MPGVGEALALLSGLSYASAYVAVAKGAGNRSGDNGALLSVVMTALLAGLAWMPGALAGGLPATDRPTGFAWFALSGVLTVVLGRVLFYVSIARLGAIRASAINRLNPFFSVLLAAALLHEVITPTGGVGMALIALGFAIQIRRMLRLARAAQSDDAGRDARAAGQASPISYLFGPASALCYASGYIARKLGLNEVPDASLGTLVGALTALLIYLAAALVSRRQRRTVLGVFANATRWHVMSATFVSVGQLAQFGAIKYIPISRVVMITSTEVVFSILLSVYVARTETRPDGETLLAALVATVGVVLIAAS